jgi:hypothetical protein
MCHQGLVDIVRPMGGDARGSCASFRSDRGSTNGVGGMISAAVYKRGYFFAWFILSDF